MRPENNNSRLVLLGLLAAFVFAVSGAAMAADPADFAEALAKAAREDKVLIVDFYTDY